MDKKKFANEVNIATNRELRLLFSGKFFINKINIPPKSGRKVIADKIGKFIKLISDKLKKRKSQVAL